MSGVRGRIAALYAVLLTANLAAWVWAFAVFGGNTLLLGTALLAYGFGLRHAVDADHIAAIDNVTRKLVQQGQRPVAVGFCFALGHSTVVIAAVAVTALGAGTLWQRFPAIAAYGGLVGPVVCAVFLFAVALINLVVLVRLCRLFRRMRRGGASSDDEVAGIGGGRGLMSGVFRGLFRLVTRSWHMYPLGFLFGLGFDTATEIGLLGMSASAAEKGLSVAAILVFPALFTAGMSLIDASDGILMVGAYGWAFVDPARKLYYNLTITGASVLVAVAVGGIEVLGLAADRFGFKGGIWDLASAAGAHFSLIGYAVIAILVTAWLCAFAIYRRRGFVDPRRA